MIILTFYYDAWGNIYPQYHNYTLSFAGTTYNVEGVSNLNGLFYKGYYYDKETGFYYLTTRYYDPEVGRFISPDDPKYLDYSMAYGHNRYAYCANNPVMFVDPSGRFWLSIIVGAVIGAVLAFTSTVVEDYKDDGKVFNGSVSWQHYMGATIGGGIAGAGLGYASGIGLIAGSAILTGEGGIGFATVATVAGVSLGTGALGYITRVAFSDQEQFSFDNMLNESMHNLFEGMISFGGSLFSGVIGFGKIGLDDKLGKAERLTNLIVRGVIKKSLDRMSNTILDFVR